MIRTTTYDKMLYSRNALNSAREIYHKYGKITIEESEDAFNVIICADTETMDQLVGEFNNYLIYIEAAQDI